MFMFQMAQQLVVRVGPLLDRYHRLMAKSEERHAVSFINLGMKCEAQYISNMSSTN